MLLEQSPAAVPPALGPADRHGRQCRSGSARAMARPTPDGFRVPGLLARTIPTRSCSASPRRGKTPAPFATASRARCGKTSTACTTSVSRFDPAQEISAGPHRFCDAIKFGSHRFHGVTDATLPHDEGWQFLHIGWSLERAEMTSRLVDVQYPNADRIARDRPRLRTITSGWRCCNRWACTRPITASTTRPIDPEKVAETADSASPAPPLDSFQRHRGAGRAARHQRHASRFLRQRSRAADRQNAGKPALRQHRQRFLPRDCMAT